MNSESDCSRRTFLGTGLAGAASFLLGAAHSVPAEAASLLEVTAATAPDDITNLSLHEVAALVKQKKISPVEITRACLVRIQALNPLLNAFITVTAESALAEARRAESEVQRGDWRGPLHGIPIALKDLFDTAGVRTTAASAVFKDRIPQEDAAVVQRLRDAGAVFLGKSKDALMWRNTRPFNLSGVPTISIPCGLTKGGLPIGLQLSAAFWREALVLRLAHTYQQATSWHTRRPKLTV